jgi:hypothetical protein
MLAFSPLGQDIPAYLLQCEEHRATLPLIWANEEPFGHISAKKEYTPETVEEF